MEYQLKINGQNEATVLHVDQGSDGTWHASWGEESHDVRCRRMGANHLFAEIDGQGVHLFVSTDKTIKHVVINGLAYTVEDAAKRRRAGGDTSQGDVTPPMPGTVMRVLVGVGDAVAEGQEVLVMSAMKMETTLYAPHAAVVKEVLVEEGEQVAAGQQLFTWEAAPEADA